MHILIVSKSNLKLQVFGLFSRFVRTLIIKISSSEEPANSTSIHWVRNGGKVVILFHPFPKGFQRGSGSGGGGGGDGGNNGGSNGTMDVAPAARQFRDGNLVRACGLQETSS